MNKKNHNHKLEDVNFGHNHNLIGDWEALKEDKILKSIVVFLAITLLLTLIGLIALWPNNSNEEQLAERSSQIGIGYEQYNAVVEQITEEECSYSSPEDIQNCRTIVITPNGGINKSELLVLGEYNMSQIDLPNPTAGQKIVIGYEPATDFYFYLDSDRRGSIILVTIIFAITVIALARVRGLLALFSMVMTLIVLAGFIAPSILNGNDPLLVAVIGSSAIAFVSLYLTHGFSPTTTVALAGTLGSLLLTLAFSIIFFRLANFTGIASEEGATLSLLQTNLNMSSLLLAGAVIGALGALDDITVTQVATIAEIHNHNKDLTISELFTSGIRVGKEHIASTVNTLLLAYAGAGLPLILLFSANVEQNKLDSQLGPLGFIDKYLATANSEVVAIELLRTFCGSVGLVAAVPITSALAAILVGFKKDIKQ